MTTTFDGVIETPLEYFLGTDKVWDFIVWTSADKLAVRDVANYHANFMVKRYAKDTDAEALLTSTATVTGAYDDDPAVNTQRLTVTLTDDSTDEEITSGLAYWELKRTDSGSEAVLAFGTIQLKRAVHRA